MAMVSVYVFSLLELIWNQNIHVTPELVNKAPFIRQKHRFLNVFQWWV